MLLFDFGIFDFSIFDFSIFDFSIFDFSNIIYYYTINYLLLYHQLSIIIPSLSIIISLLSNYSTVYKENL
jgi:hypothetical protein